MHTYHYLLTLILVSYFSTLTHGVTINRVNGSANIIYVDFSIPGAATPLELVRTYNSITATSEQNGWSGAFGWGWTSAFETALTTTPDRNVVLRDGGSGNSIIFKNEKQDPKALDSFFREYKKAYFEAKKSKKLSDQELSRLQLPDKIFSRLKTDTQYRNIEAAKFKLNSTVPKGDVLTSSEYGYQTMQFKNNEWTRTKDGITQIFDREGRIKKQIDKNGFTFSFKYNSDSKNQVTEILDQDKGVALKLSWRNDRVIEVVDNRGHKAKYSYDVNGNLTQVIDSTGQVFNYGYQNRKFPHLLTRIDYVSESTKKEKIFRELKYDDAGLVVYHREKDGGEVSYQYGRQSNDPDNNFWTKVTRKFGGTTEEIYDEYLLKARADGSKYLYKQDSKQNGATTTTVFTACCGKPLQVVKNGQTTSYKYSEDGLLLQKSGPNEEIRLEYDPVWKKISRVSQNGVTSNYSYDSKGNLITASNSRNEKVNLKYDKMGRILEMTEPTGKTISFKYGNQGKPTLITEKGTGTIRIQYDSEGRIVKTETLVQKSKDRVPSQTQSQEVIRRVMKGFQTLLDIIRPAGVSLNG